MSNKSLKTYYTLIFTVGILFFNNFSWALPFTIEPKAGTSLPRVINQGKTVFAYYTVSNNTLSPRHTNFVKYLPPNTQQVTNGTYPNTCGSVFNLAIKGQPGDSCTLQLAVSGPINAADPDPHHHLFVCFPGGISCAGTRSSLDVTSVPSLNMAYITNRNGNSISKCFVNKEGILTSCTKASDFQSPYGIAINPTRSFIYLTDQVSAAIFYCPRQNDGSLGTCDYRQVGPISAPTYVMGRLAINVAGTYIYATYLDQNSVDMRVVYCALNINNGSISNCIPTGPIVPFVNSSPAPAIAINSNQTYAYITNPVNNSVNSCTINNSNGNIFACIDNPLPTSGNPYFPYDIAVTPSNNSAYVVISNGEIALCSIKSVVVLMFLANNGNTFNFPSGIALNAMGTHAYITNYGTNLVSSCTILANGMLGICTTIGDSINGPLDVDIV